MYVIDTNKVNSDGIAGYRLRARFCDSFVESTLMEYFRDQLYTEGCSLDTALIKDGLLRLRLYNDEKNFEHVLFMVIEDNPAPPSAVGWHKP